MTAEIIVMMVGLCASVSGIVFACAGYRRNVGNDNKSDGIDEGTIISDIAHIKSSVDRMEHNVNQVDERNRNMAERLAKVEEGMSNIQKRIEEINRK